MANQVEKIHAGLFSKTVNNLKSDKDVNYYVCEVCGNTVEGETPNQCPICGVPNNRFTKIV